MWQELGLISMGVVLALALSALYQRYQQVTLLEYYKNQVFNIWLGVMGLSFLAKSFSVIKQRLMSEIGGLVDLKLREHVTIKHNVPTEPKESGLEKFIRFAAVTGPMILGLVTTIANLEAAKPPVKAPKESPRVEAPKPEAPKPEAPKEVVVPQAPKLVERPVERCGAPAPAHVVAKSEGEAGCCPDSKPTVKVEANTKQL